MGNPRGFETAVGPCRLILRMMGIYPDTTIKQTWYSLYVFVVPAFVMLYFCNVPQTIEVTKVWGDFNAVLDILTTYDVSILVATFKLCALRYKRNVLSPLLVSMLADWKSNKSADELQTMWRNAKLSRKMSITVILLAEGTIFTYFLAALLQSIKDDRSWTTLGNGTATTTRVRQMYLKGDFLYDVQSNGIVYRPFWILQFLSTFFAASCFSSIDAFFAVLVLHLCGQLNILREHLKHLPDKLAVDKGEKFLSNFSAIVERHKYLYEFANTLEEAFNLIFLVQVVSQSVTLCLQGFQLVIIVSSQGGMAILDLLFMSYFSLCFSFSIFVYCYIADVLRYESMGIGDAAYESNWYNLPVLNNRMLVIVMARAKRPFEITCGKFKAFSLDLYCSILKTCLGYVSLLLAMKDRLVE